MPLTLDSLLTPLNLMMCSAAGRWGSFVRAYGMTYMVGFAVYVAR
jgi:hypothetical protein